MQMHLFNTAKIHQYLTKKQTQQNDDQREQLFDQRHQIQEQQQQILKLMDSNTSSKC